MNIDLYDLQMLKEDRAERLRKLCVCRANGSEAVITVADSILFASCVLAESIDRLAFAVSEKQEDDLDG